MQTRIELVRDIVRSQLPGWPVESIAPLGEGEDHVAYEVHERLVVRFRLDGRGAEIEREVALLDLVASISPLAVPQPRFAAPEHCCYGYLKLDGVPLLQLEPGLRARHAEPVAASLGELLAALHATPLDHVAALAPRDAQPPAEWLREAAGLYAAAAAQVRSPRDREIRRFLDSPPPEAADAPVFSHNDLGIEHVLVDAEAERISGVIDWSDAAICDRAYDFGLLLRDLGPGALRAALGRYGDDGDIEERAWFFARCKAIEDLAYGLDSGRDEYARKSLDAFDWLFAA
jgi:aminoglycoside phosphotransferase (APT) family kinase protein